MSMKNTVPTQKGFFIMETHNKNVYKSLLELTNLLIFEVNPEGFFKRLSMYVKEHFACDRISLSIYKPETDSLEWFDVAWGVTVKKLDSPQMPLRGPIARIAIKTKQVHLIDDLNDYADNIVVKNMLEAGLKSAIAFPLLSRNIAIGAIVISYKNKLPENVFYLTQIINVFSPQLSILVENMLIHGQLKEQNEVLHEQIDSILNTNDIKHVESRFFYNSSNMKDTMKQIKTIAKSDIPVLLCGETGTGKEYLARFIHMNSKRNRSNFVKVSCPALSPTLFESELFGHSKGAFTGASQRRIGRFELANKGSIFLDEIGELDIILQAKLLHVLQDSSFERVGESKSIEVDVRCISATNADLYTMMNKGTFRRDLFYRMGVATIQIPPLRDREGDILFMFKYLVKLYAKDMQIPEPQFHPETLNLLESYAWPGNVRELSNIVSRLLVLNAQEVIGPDHVMDLLEGSSKQNIPLENAFINSLNLNSYNTNVPQSDNLLGLTDVKKNNCVKSYFPENHVDQIHSVNILGDSSLNNTIVKEKNSQYNYLFETESKNNPLSNTQPRFQSSYAFQNDFGMMEKQHIENALRQARGRVSGELGAAKILNIPRTTLQYKLKKYNILPRDFM